VDDHLMPVPPDWWRSDATAQAALVRDGVASPSELVEAALARVDAINPRLNAVITPLPDEARQLAAQAPLGAPFRGVPILLKDGGEELEGTRYTIGTAVLRDLDHRSTRTTELVRRLLVAGFVPVGKTNLPELSSGLTTEPEAFGPARNPWDLERSTGGSSGGSAAAVAAGLVAVAQGSDATGSLRVPAANCGVATLRPTPGRVPTAIPADQPSDVWSAFVLARSVRDLAGVFSAVADDAAEPAEVAQARVTVLDHDPDGRAEVVPACAETVRAAGVALRALGHDVDAEVPGALRGFMQRIAPALIPAIGHAREVQLRWLERTIGRPLAPGDLERDYPRIAEPPSEAEQASRQAVIDGAAGTLLEWWDGHDVLVTPTTRQPAWPLGLDDGPQHAGPFVFSFSFTGQPVLALPLGQSESGLPIGVQLVGRPGDDERLLALGAQLEAALPWADRWPPIALERG
jgi:amidase